MLSSAASLLHPFFPHFRGADRRRPVMSRSISLWSVSFVVISMFGSAAWAQTRTVRPAAQPRLEINRLRLTQAAPPSTFDPNGNLQPATLEGSDPAPAATTAPTDPFG